MNLARGLFYKIASPWGPGILAIHLCSYSRLPIGALFCTDVLGFALLWCRVSLLWGPFNPAVWHFAGSDSSSRLRDASWFTSKYRQWPDISYPDKSVLSDAHTGFTIHASQDGFAALFACSATTWSKQEQPAPPPGATKTQSAFPAFAIPAPFPFSERRW